MVYCLYICSLTWRADSTATGRGEARRGRLHNTTFNREREVIMKKRITALLLCLVMVLSLIPTTAWADTCTATIKFKVIPVYVDSSKNLGYDVDYASAWEGTLPCTYTSKHSSNANHSIEIKGFHPSKMGWTVRDGYKWIGWDKTTTSTPQFSTYYDWSSSPASFNGTGNTLRLYGLWSHDPHYPRACRF